MRYILLSILCLSMNALSAGQGVTKSEEPVKEQPPVKAEPEFPTETKNDFMPGEINHYEDDDVVNQPDYQSEELDPSDYDPLTPETPTDSTE